MNKFYSPAACRQMSDQAWDKVILDRQSGDIAASIRHTEEVRVWAQRASDGGWQAEDVAASVHKETAPVAEPATAIPAANMQADFETFCKRPPNFYIMQAAAPGSGKAYWASQTQKAWELWQAAYANGQVAAGAK